MRVSRKVINCFFSAFFALALLFLPSNSVFAADAAQGVEISPPLSEFKAVRGGTYNLVFKLRNVTASDLVYKVSVGDFDSANETGSPRIITDSKLPATASIITWVNSEEQFSIDSQKSKTVTIKVSVPGDAEPGGHYGVITFSGTAPEMKGTGVGLSASVGALVLITVDGDISEKASLTELFAANNGKQTSFFENSPIQFVTRIKNEGNVHVKPTGNIEVRDMIGNLVKTIPVNEDKANILPKGIRRFETELKKDWMIGRYTASLVLGYGTTGQAITGSVDFWVIPYKIILAALFILATIIYILSRLIKMYNRRIFEKAKHELSSENKNHKEK